MWRNLVFIIIIGCGLGLSGCSSVKDRDRPGVKEAKACVKAWRAQKTILEQYTIQSCTNNGVWIVRNDASGEVFDFLNKTYTSNTTGEIELSDMPDDKKAIFTSLRKDLNNELLRVYY